MSYSPEDVKQYFLKLNRSLTGGLIVVLIIASLVFWYTDTFSLHSSSTLIGLVFMILAVIFYQLPYFSYLLTRRRFSSKDRQGIEILDSGWKVFKQWLNA